MKKVLVALLILAVAGGVFAQELVIKGSVQSGLLLTATDQDDSDIGLSAYSQDAGAQTRLSVTGAYTNADKNAGFNFNLRSNVTGDSFSATSNGTYAENAYGWLKGWDGKFTLYGGKVDNGTFSTGGGVDTDLDEGVGLFGVITPVTGLDLGLGLYSTGTGITVLDHNKLKLHAAYTVPDTVKVIAGYRSHGSFTANDDQAAYIAVKVLALASAGISNLTVDAFAYNLGEFSDSGKVQIGERIEGTSGDIGFGARFRQFLKMGSAADAANYTPDLGFWVWGFYNMNEGKVVPRLDIGYVLGESKILSGRGNDSRRAFNDSIGWDNRYDKDSSSVEVRPSVQFRFGGSANFVELGYALFADLTKDIKDTQGVSLVHNVFVDYKVSF